MRGWGVTLLVFGAMASAFVLFRLPLALIFLIWIDNWGPEIGWAIRIGLMVVGLALIILGSRKAPQTPE